MKIFTKTLNSRFDEFGLNPYPFHLYILLKKNLIFYFQSSDTALYKIESRILKIQKVSKFHFHRNSKLW